MVRETHVLPGEVANMRNRATQSRPATTTVGISCKPSPCHQATQTEGLAQPVPIPIPVPVHLPTPCRMYSAPYPVPVPIPLPFPVPIFIPTTRNSRRGIEKSIKKILNKIPADPFEAELLALAGNIAGVGDSSDSDSEGEMAVKEEVGELVAHPAVPAPSDLEAAVAGGQVVPVPAIVPPSSRRGRRPSRGRGSSSPLGKRARTEVEQQRAAVTVIQLAPHQRQDADHSLKFTYGDIFSSRINEMIIS